MRVGRKRIASATIGLIAAISPVSMALANGAIGSCVVPTGCIEIEGPAGVVDAADDVSEGADKLLEDVNDTTDKATGGWTDPVTDPVVDEIKETLDLTPGQPDPATGKKHKERDRSPADQDTGSRSYSERTAAAATYQRTVDVMAAREARRASAGRFVRTISFMPPTGPGLGERLAQAALDAAKAYTFPAILIGLTVGFILVQNRIDHRDPKLAFAPVSSEQDYLSFS